MAAVQALTLTPQRCGVPDSSGRLLFLDSNKTTSSTPSGLAGSRCRSSLGLLPSEWLQKAVWLQALHELGEGCGCGSGLLLLLPSCSDQLRGAGWGPPIPN